MSKYLEFNPDPTWKGKTEKFTVDSVKGFNLGEIKWYGAWRQYAFFPSTYSVFNRDCLYDIISFINELMVRRKTNE